MLIDKSTFSPPFHYWPVCSFAILLASFKQLPQSFVFWTVSSSLQIRFRREGPMICNIRATYWASILNFLGVIHHYCTWSTLHCSRLRENKEDPRNQVAFLKKLKFNSWQTHPYQILHQICGVYFSQRWLFLRIFLLFCCSFQSLQFSISENYFCMKLKLHAFCYWKFPVTQPWFFFFLLLSKQ